MAIVIKTIKNLGESNDSAMRQKHFFAHARDYFEGKILEDTFIFLVQLCRMKLR